MHLFYTPNISGTEYLLNEEESKHCVKVLRLKEKDIIYLVDGNGGFYKAAISSISGKQCLLKVIEKHNEFGKRNYRLHVAIAPTKNIDRIEWFVEKATEIGIDEITPIICQRSERKIIKTERLEKIAVSAMKQSVKAYLPKINEAASFNDFIKKQNASLKCIAHCLPENKQELKSIIQSSNDVIILIGPEGDFTSQEIDLAIKHNYIPVSLGESRLRTETAGITACITVQLFSS
ncbi:MAG: 16S rRNA (uracil(1498)-N(3))-methyltransferase [Bacteroidia bacterium]